MVVEVRKSDPVASATVTVADVSTEHSLYSNQHPDHWRGSHIVAYEVADG